MAIDYTSLETPSDSQMVILLKHAISQLLLGGQSYSIDGQSFTRTDVDKLSKMLKYYEDKAAGNTFPKFIPIGFNQSRNPK